MSGSYAANGNLKCKNANIIGGSLVLQTNKRHEFYSIDQILTKSNEVEELDGFKQFQIQYLPEKLFEISTTYPYIDINLKPWLYTKIIPKTEHDLRLHRLTNEESPVIGGDFQIDEEYNECRLDFCEENPKRLIHYGSFGLKVYDYISADNSLKLHFNFESGGDKSGKITQETNKSDRPFRTSRARVQSYEEEGETIKNVLYSHENEVKIYGVLSMTDLILQDSMTTIIEKIDLFDENFSHLRKIKLDLHHSRSRFEVNRNVGFEMDHEEFT